MLLGPVRSLKYLGNHELLVQGEVYKPTREMKAKNFLTIMDIDYTEKGDLRETNFRWPYNISDMVFLDRNRIVLASDYLGLLVWNGMNDYAVLWRKKTDLPKYMLKDSSKTILCIMQDTKKMERRAITDGNVVSTEILPFALIAKPILLENGSILLTYTGGLALLDANLKIMSLYKATWIKDGAVVSVNKGEIFISSSNKIAKFTLR